MGSGLLDENCFIVSQQQINTKLRYSLFVHVHKRTADAQQKCKEGFWPTGLSEGKNKD